MDLFPAIDIRNGRAVRLSQGDRAHETIYHEDPVVLAEDFVGQGARWLHVVDLDRAFGDGENLALISRLVARVGSRIRIQLAGGLRTVESVRAVYHLEISRVVLGTAAVCDPAVVPAVVADVGAERVAVGLDARNGMLAIRGWAETTDQRATDVARRVIAEGIGTIIYTDVSRDGMLGGPDVAGALVLQALGAQVIVSGGVSSLDDLRAVVDAGLDGAVVGRALYEGRFTLKEGLRTVGRLGG